MAQVYVHGSRIPHPHFPDVATRFYENTRQVPITPDPPPAHRSHSVGSQPPAPLPTAGYSTTILPTQPAAPSSQQQSTLHGQPSHQTPKLVVEREIREQRDKERSSIPGI